MSNRQLIIVCIVLVTAAILFAVTTFHQQAQDRQIQNKPQSQQDEATVVQRGQITEKEREYSKEYEKLYSDRKGTKLTELSEISRRKGNKQEIGVSLGVPTIPTVGNSSSTGNYNLLTDLSCKAEAVVIGSVKNKTAHLTEDETFIYTEYELSVEDILKNNSVLPIKTGENIQITRPGGLIKLDDQLIRFEDKLYEPLQTKQKYLLFLQFVPSANGYIVSDVRGDFLLENDSFRSLSPIALPEGVFANKDSKRLFSNIRNSLLSACQDNSSGGK